MWRFFLIILAILIVLAMAGYAVSLILKLRRQRQQILQAQRERFARIVESVELIAQAMLAEQCGLSEGVLRLKPLLDVLGRSLNRFPAMWALFEVVENMPILEARQALKRNERMKLDLERESKEEECRAQIHTELAQLLAEIKQNNQMK